MKTGEALTPLIQQFQDAGIRVSLFMDPDLDQIKLAKEIGADRIELYTGPYAQAYAAEDSSFPAIHEKFREAAIFGQKLGLGINAGHDLNLENLKKFIEIQGILEVSIGHAFTVDSLLLGIDASVDSYLKTLA